VDEMLLSNVHGFQLTFRLARAFRRAGAERERALLRPAVVAALAHPDLDDLPGYDDGADPDLLVEDIVTVMWGKVRNVGDALQTAVHRAREFPLTLPPPPVPPLVARIVAIAYYLQEFTTPAPVYLSQKKLAAVLGCTQQYVSMAIRIAEQRGLLVRVAMEQPPARGRRSQEYRCPLKGAR
jgi:hypothetical protein